MQPLGQATWKSYDFAEIGSPYRVPLLRLLQSGILRGLFTSDDNKDIHESANSSCRSGRLHAHAFRLWFRTTDPQMKSELDAFFYQEDEGFQRLLMGQIRSWIEHASHEDLMFLPLLDERLFRRILINYSWNDPQELSDHVLVSILLAVVESSLENTEKESFYARFLPLINNPDEVICGIVANGHVKPSFCERYQQKMDGVVVEYYEKARFLQLLTLPFEDKSRERNYFICLIIERPQHYLFWLLAHFSEKEWDEVLKSYDKEYYKKENYNFLAEAMLHASLLGGSSQDQIEPLQNFYKNATFIIHGREERSSSWGAFSYAQPKKRIDYVLTESDTNFAKNLTPDAIVHYLLSLHEGYRLKLKYHLYKTEPEKLLAALSRALEMNLPSLPKFLKCLQTFPELYMTFLFDEPFKEVHLFCLSKCEQDLFGIGLHTVKDLSRIDRVIEWVRYLSTHPEMVVSHNFFRAVCRTGFWDLLKIRILEGDHEPSKEYIRVAMSAEAPTEKPSLFSTIQVTE